MAKDPYEFPELKKKLSESGVSCDESRRKGSHSTFHNNGSSTIGIIFAAVRCHGEGDEKKVPSIGRITPEAELATSGCSG